MNLMVGLKRILRDHINYILTHKLANIKLHLFKYALKMRFVTFKILERKTFPRSPSTNGIM